MSTLRHRFRYVLDGDQHDVMTNARDMAAAQGLDGVDGATMTWAVLHACALRLDIAGTPADLDKFIDLLDELEDLDGIPVGVSAEVEAEAGMMPSPTQQGAWAG